MFRDAPVRHRVDAVRGEEFFRGVEQSLPNPIAVAAHARFRRFLESVEHLPRGGTKVTSLASWRI